MSLLNPKPFNSFLAVSPSLSLSVLTLALGLASCSPNSPPPAAKKVAVVASNSILCDLTEQIARETIELTCLMGANQDPHTYKVTPSNRKAIETAQLVLYGGYELEPSIDRLVEKTNTSVPKVAIYELAVPEPILAAHHHHEEEEHPEDGEEKEPDPHVWQDAQNGAAIVAVLENKLAQVNPEQKDVYATNANQLIQKLSALDAWIKTQVATIPSEQRVLMTTHDSFNYYTQAYGFEASEALQGVTTEESPTAAQVKSLVEKVKTAQVPTIFAEVTANDSVIQTVAREADVKVSEQELLADSLGEQGSGRGTYIGMLASNTCTIVEGLGGQCSPFEF